MRREALRRELRQVRSRMHEHLELTKQEQALEQELAQCAQDIDQARARAELPLLQRLHVATPCKERWDDMTGDERVRFCGRCAKNVYDLSALTASQGRGAPARARRVAVRALLPSQRRHHPHQRLSDGQAAQALLAPRDHCGRSQRPWLRPASPWPRPRWRARPLATRRMNRSARMWWP